MDELDISSLSDKDQVFISNSYAELDKMDIPEDAKLRGKEWTARFVLWVRSMETLSINELTETISQFNNDLIVAHDDFSKSLIELMVKFTESEITRRGNDA